MTDATSPDLHAGGGRALHALCRDADGAWRVGDAYAGAPRASFGVRSARHGLHYLVEETDAGRIGAYRHDAGGWTHVASVPTQGAAPCHVALNVAETLLAVAHYASGSVALIRLGPDGLPQGEVQLYAHHGSGPDPQRQEGPHAHWVGFDPAGRWLYQTDLGTDQILAFPVGGDGALGTPQVAWAAPPGSGPRHLLLHPRLGHRAYLASELASTLTVLHRDEGVLGDPLVLSTLPGGWQGESIVAHIGINHACDRLYVSNRGHDSIAVFALDGDGMPTPLQHAPAGGAYPRFFLLRENACVMVVANEQSQTVTMLVIDGDGRLVPTGVSLPVPGVAYIMATD